VEPVERRRGRVELRRGGHGGLGSGGWEWRRGREGDGGEGWLQCKARTCSGEEAKVLAGDMAGFVERGKVGELLAGLAWARRCVTAGGTRCMGGRRLVGRHRAPSFVVAVRT
jgi:hypothetical protein